jgi:hypothetical protein
LGEMNNGHPADVADCVAWLLREAELLPMTTIKDIVDDYRERYHRYLATPSVESQAEFEAAITPMLQAVVDSAERDDVVIWGLATEEAIANLASNEEEIEDIESADDRKKPDLAGLSDLARLIFYLAEGGLDDAISDSAEAEAAPDDEPKANERNADERAAEAAAELARLRAEQPTPVQAATAELIDFTALSLQEQVEIAETIAEKIASGESIEAKAIVESCIVSAELSNAVWCALWWWEAPINKDAFFAWDHCFRGWQAAGCTAPVDPEIATDHRPSFADLGKAMRAWVVADIAQKIIDGKPSLAVASAKVFCQADSLPTLVWGKIEAIVATSQYAPLPSALTHFSYFIDGLGLGRKAD